MILSWVELAAREIHVPNHINGQERSDESHSHETVPPNPNSQCPRRRAHELAEGHEEGEFAAHELHVSLLDDLVVG